MRHIGANDHGSSSEKPGQRGGRQAMVGMTKFEVDFQANVNIVNIPIHHKKGDY
jgi:hypothetical protein